MILSQKICQFCINCSEIIVRIIACGRIQQHKLVKKLSRFPLFCFHPKLAKPTPPTYGRLGSLEVRLPGQREIKKAQKLRYDVFYKEGGAIADAKTALTRRDQDKFDKYCDHLIVIDHAALSKQGKVKQKIVGAYRLLTSDKAKIAGSFYSATE
jgi:putative hemolysin